MFTSIYFTLLVTKHISTVTVHEFYQGVMCAELETVITDWSNPMFAESLTA